MSVAFKGMYSLGVDSFSVPIALFWLQCLHNREPSFQVNDLVDTLKCNVIQIKMCLLFLVKHDKLKSASDYASAHKVAGRK